MPEALAILRAWWKLIPGFLIGAALAFPLGQCSGHRAGVKAEQAAEAKRLEAARAKVASREHTADKITTDTSAKLEKTKVQIQWRTKTIIEKVPTYVPQAADAQCSVNRGFVVLHDAAASGSPAGVPQASGGPLDAPSGVPLSAVAETVVGNYGVAYQWRAEALAWREWYQKQSAEWGKR
jgi:hypothetical protein